MHRYAARATVIALAIILCPVYAAGYAWKFVTSAFDSGSSKADDHLSDLIWSTY